MTAILPPPVNYLVVSSSVKDDDAPLMFVPRTQMFEQELHQSDTNYNLSIEILKLFFFSKIPEDNPKLHYLLDKDIKELQRKKIPITRRVIEFLKQWLFTYPYMELLPPINDRHYVEKLNNSEINLLIFEAQIARIKGYKSTIVDANIVGVAMVTLHGRIYHGYNQINEHGEIQCAEMHAYDQIPLRDCDSIGQDKIVAIAIVDALGNSICDACTTEFFQSNTNMRIIASDQFGNYTPLRYSLQQ